jgi:hypothetical protein
VGTEAGPAPVDAVVEGFETVQVTVSPREMDKYDALAPRHIVWYPRAHETTTCGWQAVCQEELCTLCLPQFNHKCPSTCICSVLSSLHMSYTSECTAICLQNALLRPAVFFPLPHLHSHCKPQLLPSFCSRVE